MTLNEIFEENYIRKNISLMNKLTLYNKIKWLLETTAQIFSEF